MIEAHSIFKRFSSESEPIIKGIDIRINDGDFVSMMGRSGSGKSTLLYILSTLDRSFDGSVLYDGIDIKKMNAEKIHATRNKDIGFVFQFHYLLNELTAIENILLPARKANQLDQKESFARELLAHIGLSDKAERLPANLSGGEQQRVAIARALIMQPKYLFADEPTGNLDSANGKVILDLFERFNKDYGTTIVYVTHDKEFGERAKKKIQLMDGIIVN
ncbi:putative ABC transport system ATP-binding protein/lipoprotein-releasing system ATP-binding protein [Bacteriovorax stolpii]|nr:ABC transporter ATP-binding protein [Bacteriovorax stolpii]TDP52519.1 putative ABC transport system ATP-binding protein/lipoprotein-releasing system ATP-binding protein [Bacteriovorax stolpii]